MQNVYMSHENQVDAFFLTHTQPPEIINFDKKKKTKNEKRMPVNFISGTQSITFRSQLTEKGPDTF